MPGARIRISPRSVYKRRECVYAGGVPDPTMQLGRCRADLVGAATAAAKREGISRARWIERALEAALDIPAGRSNYPPGSGAGLGVGLTPPQPHDGGVETPVPASPRASEPEPKNETPLPKIAAWNRR